MIKAIALNEKKDLPKIWTKDFILINLSALCLYLSYQMLLTILPTFISHKGGGQFTIGLIISLYTIASLFIRPLFSLGLAGLFYGAGFGLNLPTLQAWAVAKALPHRRGAATGIYHL